MTRFKRVPSPSTRVRRGDQHGTVMATNFSDVQVRWDRGVTEWVWWLGLEPDE